MTQPDGDQARWNRRYARGQAEHREPSSVLVGLDPQLRREGCALDLAGGSGRNALWLAERGLDVTLSDVSDVALGHARQLAKSRGVGLTTVQRDVVVAGVPAASDAQPLWDLIVCFNFIDRALYSRLPEHLQPGGQLLIAHPTVRNTERHARPSARFLLDEGELPTLVSGLQVLRCDEGWLDGEHHLALLLAVKSATEAPA